MKQLIRLPKVMAERALWAREDYIENPEDAQADDNMMIWCHCPEDGLWYSVDGNYSRTSPKEKLVHEEEKEYKVESLAKKHYERVLYYSEIRVKVLERDNHTCQRCFATAPSKFHIHHILKRKEGGGDFLDNLITVCHQCHLPADKKLYNPPWEIAED